MIFMFTCANKTTRVVHGVGDKPKYLRKTVVDQYPASKFNIGMNGFIENDITLVSRCTSLEQLKRLAARLQEVPKNNPDNTKKSIIQISRETLDRYSQTPSELVRAQEFLIRQVSRDKVTYFDPNDNEKEVSTDEVKSVDPATSASSAE